ncbi:hypothetical protein EV196_109116 [Mariniflexile fucanivorans]|uniref:Uncharacterized protein n=1 Tax=Mariniflexile fucanivorans TaxID=264023 RepID=A0A4R1RD09_9FLAO|nr:hypothetical protein [Mariniflexile fucanivorans]TCL63490.1 hypothetical protein EV196_109116 [Mariniflexile fucanivorans]
MINIKKFGIAFLFTFILLGCDSNSANIELDNDNPIIGNWKLVE